MIKRSIKIENEVMTVTENVIETEIETVRKIVMAKIVTEIGTKIEKEDQDHGQETETEEGEGHVQEIKNPAQDPDQEINHHVRAVAESLHYIGINHLQVLNILLLCNIRQCKLLVRFLVMCCLK